MANKAVLCQQW